MKSVYIIGSLRNPMIHGIGDRVRELGFEAFNDWLAAGEFADDAWKAYEQGRGRTYAEALQGYAAKHVYEFDLLHLNRCDIGVLVCPAGKSGHLELGYMIGQGKPGYILLDSPDRWDVMYQFATKVFTTGDDLYAELQKSHGTRPRSSPQGGLSSSLLSREYDRQAEIIAVGVFGSST